MGTILTLLTISLCVNLYLLGKRDKLEEEIIGLKWELRNAIDKREE